jgi:uncharacterized protein YacL
MTKRTNRTAKKQIPVAIQVPPVQVEGSVSKSRVTLEALTKPGTEFTKALADEIVKGLTRFGQLTTKPFRREEAPVTESGPAPDLGEYPILVDTSILIDGRILPIVNSGFLTGTLLVPQFVLGEVQHIADSSDAIRRAKGRRGLEVVSKLKWQKVNPLLKTKVIEQDLPEVKEVDHKLVALARKWRTQSPNIRLMTVDFNLAHLARAQGVHVLNVQDVGQALKVSLVPGEEFTLKIAHVGKEAAQGVGYLVDGTMVIVDNAADKIGIDVVVVVVKIHQTPAGQLFFARLK